MATPGVESFAQSQQLVCAGRMEPQEGFREALWAFDILRFVAPDLRLQLIGTGSERPTLERFVYQNDLQNLVEFTVAVPDLMGALLAAAVVWVPSLAPVGVQVRAGGGWRWGGRWWPRGCRNWTRW